MAAKQSKSKTKPKARIAPATKVEVPVWLTETPIAQVVEKKYEEEGLDPQEEKILDWILKGVVGFVLVWLGISVLMVIGGFFHLWG